MAADQERADRIRALKLDRPDLTWRRIADHVGVSERAATDWQKKGGIEYDNAKRLAALFEVDVDYIWRGPTGEERAPSPFAGQDAVLDALEALTRRLDALDARLADIEALLRQVFEHRSDQGTDIIDRLDGLEANVEKGLQQLDKALNASAVAQVDEIVRGIVEDVQTGKLPKLPPTTPTKAAKTAPKNNRAA